MATLPVAFKMASSEFAAAPLMVSLHISKHSTCQHSTFSSALMYMLHMKCIFYEKCLSSYFFFITVVALYCFFEIILLGECYYLGILIQASEGSVGPIEWRTTALGGEAQTEFPVSKSC